MHLCALIFTYSTEGPLLEPHLKRLEETLNEYCEKNPSLTYEVVYCEDANHPVDGKYKTATGKRFIASKGNRRGNLRGYAWIKEQVDIMCSLDCDIIMKTDVDCYLNEIHKFLDPFVHEGFKGMNGFHGRTKNHVLGACYVAAWSGLIRLQMDIYTIWNTLWMDEVGRYLVTFYPSMGDCLPVNEDVVISMWFHARDSLKVMDLDVMTGIYDWTNPKVDKPVMWLGNPGPPALDNMDKIMQIAAELKHPRFDKKR